ncbi:MAG: AsmA family protein, partial [Gammaproteobacteria bacterium]|nr:AsmA family protein [Gammaproteobacteria bacterium]
RKLAEKFAISLPDSADKNVLTKASAQMSLQGSLNKMNLSKLNLVLDDSQLTGTATYKPMPAVSTVKLAIDKINLDRYLPEPVETKDKAVNKKSTSKKSSRGIEPVLIPVGLLTAINANADFKVNKIQVMKTHWSNFHIAASSKNGLIIVKPLTMYGYDAKAKAELKLRAVKSNALLSGKFDLQNFKAGQLLNDFIGKDKLKGITSISASFNTSGIKLSQLKQNLNGNLKLKLKDGTLKGFDLDHQKKVLDAKIKRQPEPKAPVPAETKIASLSASAVIKKGVLTNKDLRAATPLARVIGRGTVDIAKEKLNYTASVKFTSATDIKYNKPFEKMSAVPLDIRITGSFDKPSVKPDFEKVLKSLVKKEIKKEKKKITDKAKKDLENKVKDKLKNLFKF